MSSIALRRLAPGEYEFDNLETGEDGHIRKEGSSWILSIFRSEEANADAAFLGGGSYPSLRQAIAGYESGDGVVV